MLIEFVRDKKNRRVGVIVALSPSQIGYSLCKKNDRFNRDFGVRVATERAADEKERKIPHSLSAAITKMQNRATRYFK